MFSRVTMSMKPYAGVLSQWGKVAAKQGSRRLDGYLPLSEMALQAMSVSTNSGCSVVDEVKRATLSELEKISVDTRPIPLKPGQAVGVVHQDYAAQVLLSRYTIAFGDEVPIVQFSHESVPTFPGFSGRGILKGDDVVSSYLNPTGIVDTIRQFNRDNSEGLEVVAMDPGWGFDSENPVLSRTVRDSGLTFLGPNPESLERGGDKVLFKRLCKELRIPTMPFEELPQDPSQQVKVMQSFVERHRQGNEAYSLMIKTRSGGGGKGMRSYSLAKGEPFNSSTALELVTEAVREGAGASGETDVFIEEKVVSPWHWELQMLGNQVVGARDCSLQKPGFQKVFEQTLPEAHLPAYLLPQIKKDAARLATALGYDSAGTLEVLARTKVDPSTGETAYEYGFMEMNGRKQVEHPVTDLSTLAVTTSGLVLPFNLAAETLRLAMTGEQTLSQFIKHQEAAQIRVVFQNPSSPEGWGAEGGFVSHVSVPNHRDISAVIKTGPVRLDADSQVGAIFVTAPDNATLMKRCLYALEHTHIGGRGATVLPMLAQALQDSVVRSGNARNDYFSDPKHYKCVTAVVPGNVEQAFEVAVREQVVPAVVTGPTRAGKVLGGYPSQSVFDRVDGVISKYQALPRQPGSLDVLKEDGFQSFISGLLQENTLKLELRDILQAVLDSNHTPETWEKFNLLLTRIPETNVTMVESISGAAPQAGLIYAGFHPFELYQSGLNGSIVTTHLARTNYVLGLQQIRNPEERQFIWQAFADATEAKVGRTKDGRVPAIWYTFHAGNHPDSIADSTNMINRSGMIGVPTICYQPGQTGTFAKANVIDPVFGELDVAPDIVYLKNPTGFDDASDEILPEVIDNIRAIKAAHKEHFGRDCVVMYHAHDQARNATRINRGIAAAFPEGGVVLGGAISGYRTHADSAKTLEAVGKSSGKFKHLATGLRACLDIFSHHNSSSTAESELDTKMPGGMGGSAYRQTGEMGVSEHLAEDLYNLGGAIVGLDIGVTPHSQYKFLAGINIYKAVFPDGIASDGSEFELLSESERIDRVVDYIRSGNVLSLPDDVLIAMDEWKCVYPKPEWVELILKNEPAPKVETVVSTFDPEAVRKSLSEKYQIPITNQDVAAVSMYGESNMAGIFENRKAGHSAVSLSDRVRYRPVNTGDVFAVHIRDEKGVLRIRRYTCVAKEERPGENGERMVVLVDTETGNVIADSALHPSDVVAKTSDRPKANLQNPFHIPVKDPSEITNIFVEVGDTVTSEDKLYEAVAAKLLGTVKVPGSLEGEFKIKSIHVVPGDKMDKGDLAIELEEVN